MRKMLIGLALLCAPTLCSAQVANSQPGIATGSYGDIAGSDAAAPPPPITLHYAVALRKDDVEHALDEDAGIWVLLSDRPVDVMALSGGIFPQVTALARTGAFEGLLFVVNDAAKSELHVRVLSSKRHPDASFESLTLSGDGVWKSLAQTPHGISGAIDREGVHFTFDAPITDDPVQQDILGKPALAAAPAQVIIRNANAWIAGDLAGVEATTSKRRWAELADMPAEARKQVLAQARGSDDLVKAKDISRVTMRARTATVKTAGGFQDLILEDGVWKVD